MIKFGKQLLIAIPFGNFKARNLKKMINIEINRWTIQKLEEAIDKYNKENRYSLHEYVDMINKLLELYLSDRFTLQLTSEKINKG